MALPALVLQALACAVGYLQPFWCCHEVMMMLLPAGQNEGALESVMALPAMVLQALAFAVDYLKPFGMDAVLQMSNSFRPFNTRQEMALSANTLTCAARGASFCAYNPSVASAS